MERPMFMENIIDLNIKKSYVKYIESTLEYVTEQKLYVEIHIGRW